MEEKNRDSKMKILTRLVAIGIVIISIISVSIYVVSTRMPDPKENAIECAKQIIWDNIENTSSITFPWRKNKWDISQTGDTFYAIVDLDTKTFYDTPAKKKAQVCFTVTGKDADGGWQYSVEDVSIFDMKKVQGARPAVTANKQNTSETKEKSDKKDKAAKAKKETAKPTTQKKEQVTLGKRNALQSAKDYLKYTSFSRKGLIEQLKYEGYNYEEAVYAVDRCGANWKSQAAKSAKEYLTYTSFSRIGLIGQLEYEGFSHEQAIYGVEAAGY